MKVSIIVPLALGIFTKVSATPLVNGLDTKVCDGAVTLASIWIGEAKNVEIKSVFCPNQPQARDVPSQHVLGQPQLESAPGTNVCSAPCTTTCFTPAGGGPDPNDCHVIADALRFDSENIGPTFDINNAVDVVLKYKSCKTFFHNQSVFTSLTYCRTDWASLVDFIAPKCQAQQNAHGGLCVANDKAWFVQVNHV